MKGTEKLKLAYKAIPKLDTILIIVLLIVIAVSYSGKEYYEEIKARLEKSVHDADSTTLVMRFEITMLTLRNDSLEVKSDSLTAKLTDLKKQINNHSITYAKAKVIFHSLPADQRIRFFSEYVQNSFSHYRYDAVLFSTDTSSPTGFRPDVRTSDYDHRDSTVSTGYATGRLPDSR